MAHLTTYLPLGIARLLAWPRRPTSISPRQWSRGGRQDLFYRLCIVVLTVPPLLRGRNRCVKQRSGLDTVDGAGGFLGCGKARRNVIAAHGAQDLRPQGAFAL